MPIAQALVSDATVSPPPIAAATHLSLGDGDAGQDAGEHDRAGDQPDLTLEVPALRAAVDREAVGLPGGDPAVKDVHVGQPGVAQGLLGLCGALTGAADQHHVLVKMLDDLVTVLA